MATTDPHHPNPLSTVRGVIAALEQLDPDNLVQIQNAGTDESGWIVSMLPDPLNAGTVVVTYAPAEASSP
jgi:hypothetical protein